MKPEPIQELLASLLRNGEQIFLLGVVLQEILQGIRDPLRFKKIKNDLSLFPILELGRNEYEIAAELYNDCRSNGIQIGTIDALIAAASVMHECHLLTVDQDFERIAPFCGLRLMS